MLETYTATATPAHTTCGLARCGATVPPILGYSFLLLLPGDGRGVGANATHIFPSHKGKVLGVTEHTFSIAASLHHHSPAPQHHKGV